MGTALFDTSVVPHWRTTGSVILPAAMALQVGDPCHGLEDLGVIISAGTWVWEVRDADENGVSAHRVWEVRLRREDQGPALDWAWDDDYGRWAEEPAPGAQIISSRGVDAGIIAWRLTDRDDHGDGEDRDLLDFQPFDGVPVQDGRLFGTSSGWGDGCYPIATRVVDGELLEVRACYITVDPDPLTAAEFTALLPGAFMDAPTVTGPFTLHLTRTSYTAADHGDTSALVDRVYDTLHSVSATGPDGQIRLVQRYLDSEKDGTLRAYESVAAVQSLWSRVDEQERDRLVALEEVGEPQDRPDHARGWIVSYTTSEVAVRLAH